MGRVSAYSSSSSSRALTVGLPACDNGKCVPISSWPSTSISTDSFRSRSLSCSMRKSMLISACSLQFSQFCGEFGWKKAHFAIGWPSASNVTTNDPGC